MPTEDAYFYGHRELSHFWTFLCSNVETYLSWTCLISWLLSLEHPSVFLFYLRLRGNRVHLLSDSKYTDDDIIYMLKFLVDNIFSWSSGGKVFQQIVGIPMGTNCGPFLADIFLYSYEAESIQSLLFGWKETFRISVQLHTSMTYCQSIIQILTIILARYIPLSLR